MIGSAAPSRTALARLLVDRVSGEVTRALGDAGIPSVLLKGPGVVFWLYDPGERRTYADSDILVPPGRFEDAERVLARLGFEPRGRLGRRAGNATPWVRERDGGCVDLHRSLACVPAHPGEIWAAFADGAVPMEVGGTILNVPPEPARAFHIALHAAQHGTYTVNPRRDLALAIERVPIEVWREAARVARTLEALRAFATGLRLVSSGVVLARRLGLPADIDVELVLRRGHETHDRRRWGLNVDRFVRTPGWRAKTGLVARALFPAPEILELRYRLATRGPVGLALAYPVRVVSVVWRAGAGLGAWNRARRLVRTERPA